MNKAQLVEELSTRFEGNKKEAQHALESVLDTITRAVAGGEKVSITGFGAFEKVDRPSRMVRNPQTGERKRTKKTSVPKFRPGSELKAVVSGSKKLAKAQKSPATKSTAKTTAKTTSSRTAAASKSTAAKSTAKKTPATKSTATKSTAKSTAAKQTTAKSPAKSTTKKTTAKKAPATKSTAKKTTAKSPAKSTTKKTTAKKTAKR